MLINININITLNLIFNFFKYKYKICIKKFILKRLININILFIIKKIKFIDIKYFIILASNLKNKIFIIYIMALKLKNKLKIIIILITILLKRLNFNIIFLQNFIVNQIKFKIKTRFLN